MSEYSPRLSVLLPVHNGARYLKEAVDSVLDQTYVDFEFVIVNDGSTDETAAILANYKDSRLEIINVSRLGIVGALNEGLKYCRGEFIARMDADDISRKDRFTKQIAYFDAHTDVDILCTDILVINSQGTVTGFQCERDFDNQVLRQSLQGTRVIKPIIHPTVMMRRKVVETLKGYRNFAYCEDADLWLRALDRFTFRRLNDFLLSYRIHAEGISRNNITTQAVSGVMSRLNYHLFSQYGIDIFEDRPSLFSRLADLARIRLTAEVLPAQIDFRKARVLAASGRKFEGAFRLAVCLLHYGPIAIPTFSVRRSARILVDLIKEGTVLLDQTDAASLEVTGNPHR